MTQRTSNKGLMEIIAHEAIVLSPYRDVKDIWTIGVGHTAMAGGINPVKFKGQLTLAGALHVFRTDLAKYERRVAKAFTRPLSQHEFDAAVSFDFNTGAIDRATWVETFNSGNRELAIQQIMNWQKEQLLFASGHYNASGTAMVYPASKTGAVLWNAGKRVDLAGLFSAAQAVQRNEPKTTPKSLWQRFLLWLKQFF
jgi:lysozyme